MARPQTLLEAVTSGLDKSKTLKKYCSMDDCIKTADEITPYVQAFLANKFNPRLMEFPEVVGLWNDITGESKVHIPNPAHEQRLKVALCAISSLLIEAYVLAQEHGPEERNKIRESAINIFKGLLPEHEVVRSVIMADLNLGEKE